VAVRIRMKQMGRAHRPFFRICAIDKRAPRDGKVLEELGTYDPMVPDTDARVRLKAERVDYWLSVGALPSEKCAVLIKKYGTNGTHVSQAQSAQEQLSQPKVVPPAGPPVSSGRPSAEEASKEEASAPPEPEAAVDSSEEAAPADQGGSTE
jgi:small subunit ribosomal protein S16